MPKVHNAGGDAGQARGGRGRRVTTTLAEINVVPLVDVMLVLLIIFMVTAPMIQRGVDVKLPVTRSVSTQIERERLFVSVPAGFRHDRRVQLGDEFVKLEILATRVEQRVANKTDKEIYLRGDGSVTYQELMQVFDELKKAGIVNVGLVTRAPEER